MGVLISSTFEYISQWTEQCSIEFQLQLALNTFFFFLKVTFYVKTCYIVAQVDQNHNNQTGGASALRDIFQSALWVASHNSPLFLTQ